MRSTLLMNRNKHYWQRFSCILYVSIALNCFTTFLPRAGPSRCGAQCKTSSRELGIEGSRSFLCLFIIFTAQKCPFYQSSVSLKCPYSWRRHKHSFWPLFPWAPLCFPAPLFVPLLHCQSVLRFCPKFETRQCPWAKVCIRSGRIIRLSSSVERAILLSCSVKTSWWRRRTTFTAQLLSSWK